MKKSLYISLSLILFLSLYSCKKELNTAEESVATFLPVISVAGDANVFSPCGETYVDAGATASEGGSDIAVSTAVAGNYFGGTSVSGADEYVISYSALNKDNIPGAEFRTVIVEPCNDGTAEDIAGIYSSNTLRDNGEGYDVSNVYIVRTGANTFALSDVLGGFYDLGRGYGSDYSCKGAIFTVNSATDITMSTGQFPVWENLVDATVSVDGTTLTLDCVADFGATWQVVLTRM